MFSLKESLDEEQKIKALSVLNLRLDDLPKSLQSQQPGQAVVSTLQDAPFQIIIGGSRSSGQDRSGIYSALTSEGEDENGGGPGSEGTGTRSSLGSTSMSSDSQEEDAVQRSGSEMSGLNEGEQRMGDSGNATDSAMTSLPTTRIGINNPTYICTKCNDFGLCSNCYNVVASNAPRSRRAQTAGNMCSHADFRSLNRIDDPKFFRKQYKESTSRGIRVDNCELCKVVFCG